MYSAPTRVGSMPEDVMAAMCAAEGADMQDAGRTTSGTRRAVRPAPPPLPSAALRSDTPEPFSAVRPRTDPPRATEVEPLVDYELMPTQSIEIVEAIAPASSGLLRSIFIVALFAVLGALAACAIMLAF